MASSRIQGITIEIDGNTSGLNDALKSVDQQAKDLQKELREVDQALRLDPTNVDLMSQRQQILAQSISTTSERLDILRQSQAQVEQQFAQGDIGAEQYRAFQRELSNTESRLGSLSNEVTSSAQNQQRLIQSTRDFNTLLAATGTELDDYVELLGSRMTNAIRNGTASTDQMNRAIRLVGQNATGASTELGDLQQALRNVDNGSSLTDIRQDLIALGNSAETATREVNQLQKAAKNVGAVAAGGVAAGIAGMFALTEATDETNRAMARLKAGAEQSGNSFDTMQEAVVRLSSVTGDTRAAVETVNNLMASGFKDSDLLTMIENVSGAYVKFSDTLSSEGIADGIQETIALGEATGSYGELLERHGIDLENFNAQLQAQGTDADKAKFAMEEFTKLGLQPMAQEYRDLNPELVANSEATASLEQAMADFAIVIMPVVTAIKELATEMLEWATANKDLVIQIGAIAAAATALSTAFLLIGPLLKSIVDSFKFLQVTMALLTGPIGLIAVGLAALGAALAYAYTESETFRDGVNDVFESVKNFIIPIVEEIVSFVKTQFEDLKSFWDENGAMILDAVEVAWTAIQAVFETVMPIIQSIVESVWESIKGIIEGALGVITGLIKTFSALLTGDFSTAWEGVKETFSSAVKFITNLVEVWIVGKVLGMFKTFGTALVNTIKATADKVKSLFKEMVDKIKSYFKVDEFIQLGKDVISGFVKGITDTAKNAVKAVGDVMGNVIKAAKRALDSHSPSKEFIALGHDTLDGYNIGMEDREKLVTGTMTDIMGNLIDVADHYASEEQKIAEESGKKIAEIERKQAESIAKIKNSTSKKNQSSASENAKKIQQIEKDSADKIEAIQKKAIVDTNKLMSQQRKDEMAELQSYIDNKNSLNELGVLEEIAIWETASKYFEEGSAERIKSQQNYQKAVENINKQVLSTNESFTSQMNKITEDFTVNSQKLWDDYNKEFDAAVKGIQSSLGGLDSVFKTAEVSGQDMITAQVSQVQAMEEWRSTMESLFGRIDNDDLIKELEELGIKGLGQLKGLNELSQPELDHFVAVYDEKFKLAREMAEGQMSQSKDDVEKNIKAMRRASSDQLDQLQDEWKNKIQGITKGTDQELMTLQQVGVNAGNALLNGLSSTEGELTSEARRIAEMIKSTIGETLGVDIGVSSGGGSSGGASSALSGFGSAFGGVGNALSNTKNSMNNMRNGIQKASNQNIKIGVSDIYMDSKLVGQATFNTVNGMQYNDAGIKGIFRGVTI